VKQQLKSSFNCVNINKEDNNINVFAFEGIDGIGKTKMAIEVCKRTGYNYQKFPTPNSYIGKTIRDILQGKRNYEPLSFQALNFLDKKTTDILPNTILDRYKLSQTAYGLLDVPLHVLNEMNYLLPEPDGTFVFIGTPFRKDKEIFGDRMERLTQIYEDLLWANRWNKKYVRIEANRPVDEVVSEICELIFKLEM
jgi:thymidylate kinase